MIARIGILAALLVGLVAWDRSLGAEREIERGERMLVRQLLTDEQRSALRVAALVLERGPHGGERDALLYVRQKGIWRCRSVFDVPARQDLVQDAMDRATRAEGVVQSPSPRRPERYGFDGPDMLTLRLHGPDVNAPDRDLQFELDIGASIPRSDGCYVRRPGETAIWAIATDLRAALDWSGGADLPPLLDPYVVPAAWMAEAGNLLRILTRPLGGTEFELVLSFLPPEQVEKGAPPWQWRLRTGGEEHGVNPVLGVGYNLFVQRTPYVGIVDPARAQELVGDRLAGRITLVPRNGEDLELLIGRPFPDGPVPVFNRTFGLLFLVAPDVGALLLPDPAVFDEVEGENPWDPYLHDGGH